jgi:FMN-dependent NADH-azoreductase
MKWGIEMNTILVIRCSPKTVESHSSAFAVEFVEQLQQMLPTSTTKLRDLSANPIAHVTSQHALASEKAFENRTLSDEQALHISDTLIEELETADYLVIATPMHNYTVPSVLKAWIDHVVRAHRTIKLTPQGKIGLIGDKRTYIIVSSGGHHKHQPSWQPDFLTPYLTEILRTIGITSVEFIYLEAMSHGQAASEQAITKAREHADQIFTILPTQL